MLGQLYSQTTWFPEGLRESLEHNSSVYHAQLTGHFSPGACPGTLLFERLVSPLHRWMLSRIALLYHRRCLWDESRCNCTHYIQGDGSSPCSRKKTGHSELYSWTIGPERVIDICKLHEFTETFIEASLDFTCILSNNDLKFRSLFANKAVFAKILK